MVRKVTHAQIRYLWADRDERLHRCRGSRRNHLCRFVWLSLTGFGRGGGSNFGLLYWLALSPLQHSRTTVRVCDYLAIYGVGVARWCQRVITWSIQQNEQAGWSTENRLTSRRGESSALVGAVPRQYEIVRNSELLVWRLQIISLHVD